MAFLNYKLCLVALLCTGLVLENVSARPSDDYDLWESSEEVPRVQPPPPAPVPQASETNDSDGWEDSSEKEVKPPAPIQSPPVKDSFESEEEVRPVVAVQPPAPAPAKDSFESEEEVKLPAPIQSPPLKDSFESEEEVRPEVAVQPPATAVAKDSFESEEEVKPAALPVQPAAPGTKDSFEAKSEEEVKAGIPVPFATGLVDSFESEEPKAEPPKQIFPPKSARLIAHESEEWPSDEDDFIAAPKAPSVPAPAAPVAPAPSAGGVEHHHHHHEASHTAHDDTEAVNPLGPSPVVFQSGTPIVHVEFGGSCGFEETSGRCDPGRNMECSATSNKCICKSSSHVYVPGARQCLQVSSRATSYSCTYNEQCHSEDSLGLLSICNTETNRCECSKTSNVPIVQVNGKCLYQKYIGDGCPDDNHEVCRATLPHSICIYRPANNTEPAITVIDPNSNMICLCDDGYTHDPSQEKPEECQAVGRDESSPCKFDAQCTAGLGPLSRCFANTCQCADVGRGQAVFYKGTCYPRLSLGDVCQSDDQCRASIHDNAVCAEHESYMAGEKVCHCPDGKKCDGNGATTFSQPTLTILLTNLIIMTVGATSVLQF